MSAVLAVISRCDVWLLELFNVTLRNPLFSLVMPVFEQSRNWVIPLAVAWLVVMIRGGKRGRWIALGALVVIFLTDQIGGDIKQLVGRIRPCNVLPGIYMWHEGGWIVIPETITQVYKNSLAFPSNHAINIAGQAVWWGLFYPKFRWWFVGIALIVGYSRIYDGVHYPFDVLGGFVLGGAIAGLLYRAVRRWKPELPSGAK